MSPSSAADTQSDRPASGTPSGHASTSGPSTGESIVAFAVFAAVAAAAAVGGSLVNQDSMDWYDGLDKPGFTPPGAAFGIVWTILYALIAIAGWLAWRAAVPAGAAARPTAWWGLQMGLNFLWTAVFFGAQSPIGGLVVIAALIGAIVVNIAVARRFSRAGAALLVPYLLWCGFACALNIGVVVLN